MPCVAVLRFSQIKDDLVALFLALYFVLLSPQASATGGQALPDVTGAQHAAQPRPPCRADPSAIPPVRCGITPPKVLHYAYPEFSEEARRKKVGGVVGVVLTVDEAGNPQNVQVFKSLADKVDPKNRKAALSLDQQAINAVKKYKFSPATSQGKPVPVELHVDVNFQIF